MTDDIEHSNGRVDYGPLAAALAKAQSSFPAIARDKTVTVQTRTGGSYTFKYAPLDSILAAVRAPLADNGLAISQLLDGHDLVTMLLHKDGATLTGRVPLPRSDGDTVQALGSAITYLRRYSLQAMLGIAAEEDDDGNRASGNRVQATGEARATGNDGLIGKVATSGTSDYNLRQTPDDGWRLPFRVKEGNKVGQIVLAEDALALALEPLRDTLMGQLVTVWGTYTDEASPPKPDGYVVHTRVLHLTRIKWAGGELPAPEEAPTEPLGPVNAAEEAEIAALPW